MPLMLFLHGLKMKTFTMRKNLMVAALICTAFTATSQTLQVGNTTLTQSDVVTGLTQPWEILWGPDGYIWCTTRPGKVLRIDPATGNYTELFSKTVPNNGSNEPGMLGMAFHPDFPTTPKVYIVYCYSQAGGIRERLVSCDYDGTDLVNETTLIDAIPGDWIHNGSRVIISPDQKILMTTGDRGTSSNSQNIASLNGKVLRVNLDGTIPADNPDPSSYVYSWGHRNGQGLCLGPNGIIYESEHGQNTSDELNILEAGRNYGWPNVEGVCNTASEQTFCAANDVKEPIREWSPCIAVNGIEYYNHPAIPEWQNSIIMAVLGGLGNPSPYRRLSVLHLSADGLSVESEDQYLSSLGQRMRDICFNPTTGAVYIALNGTAYPGNGSNRIIELRNLNFVSVEENKPTDSQSMKVFPNPAKSWVQLEVSATLIGSTAVLYSHLGERVRELKLTQSLNTMDVTDLAAGAYYISASSALGTVSKAFIKE
jgi:aldose sugar dehydrogenase